MHIDLIFKSNKVHTRHIYAMILDLQTCMQEHYNCCKQVYNSIKSFSTLGIHLSELKFQISTRVIETISLQLEA